MLWRVEGSARSDLASGGLNLVCVEMLVFQSNERLETKKKRGNLKQGQGVLTTSAWQVCLLARQEGFYLREEMLSVQLGGCPDPAPLSLGAAGYSVFVFVYL